MCNYLHLRAFENRPFQMADWISGHAVNPMNQPYLSQIPLRTLHLSYQQQENYDPLQALQEAVMSLCDPTLAKSLMDHLSLLQDQGLEQMEPKKKAELMAQYQPIGTKFSQEIVGWLQGDYPFSTDCLTM